MKTYIVVLIGLIIIGIASLASFIQEINNDDKLLVDVVKNRVERYLSTNIESGKEKVITRIAEELDVPFGIKDIEKIIPSAEGIVEEMKCGGVCGGNMHESEKTNVSDE
jgi:hypothetical protein